MKNNRMLYAPLLLTGGKAVFPILAFALFATGSLRAQSVPDAAADAMQRRVARARALAAAHDLPSAATELNAIRNTATDSSIKDVARIMLMGIYLEQGDYARAGALLEDTFKARIAQDEGSKRSYFALAGQAVNGARAHLERYREFGINVADKELPPESVNDLDRLRLLLESIADQAKKIGGEDAKSMDSMALLEDVASVRRSLARNDQERKQWQREFADVRQQLATSETRVGAWRATTNHSGGSMFLKPTSDSTSSNVATTSPTGQSLTSSSVAARTIKTNDAHAATPVASNVSNQSPAPHASTKSAGAAEPSAATNENSGGQPLEVGSLLEKATQKIAPTYPSVAKNARVAGVVTVYLVIDENGAVASVERASGPQLLRAAAQDAARRWKFRPTLIDGRPTRVTGFINFNFTL